MHPSHPRCAACAPCLAVALFFAVPAASASPLVWTGAAGDGSWQSALNWNPVGVPFGAGQAASISGSFGAMLAVTASAPVTLGSLSLGNNSGSLQIGAAAPGGVFTLTGTSGPASLSVVAGAGATQFSAPVHWTNDLTITQNSAAGPLTFTGAVRGTGTLTLDGPGRVVMTGSTAGLTGALSLSAGRLDLSEGLANPGGDVSLSNAAVLVSAKPVNRAIAGTAAATLAMQASRFDGQSLQYGYQFGDASRSDGFTFRGALRVDNENNAGVSARFDSAASIVIDRPQEINSSIYTFANGLTLTGNAQFSGNGVIVGKLTDLTTHGTPFAPTGAGIAFTGAIARIEAGAADVHYLGHDLRVGALAMGGGTLRYYRADPSRPRFLDLYGPLTGRGIIEADYLTGYTTNPTLVSVTGPLTVRGIVGAAFSHLDVQVAAAGVFRVEGATAIDAARFQLAGGRIELPNVLANTVPASQFSGYGTILFGNFGSVVPTTVPLVGPATGAVSLDQALDVGSGLGIFHSNAPVVIGPAAALTLANGMIRSRSGYRLTGAGRISGYGLIAGTITDQTGGAGGLVATGSVTGLPTLVLPEGDLTVLSQSNVTLPFSAAGRTAATMLYAPNGVTLQQQAEAISSPQPLNVQGSARIVGDFNAGPLAVMGNVQLAGGTVRAPLSATGTLSGWGVVDGPVLAASVVPVGTLGPLGDITFNSGSHGLLLSDSVVNLNAGSTFTLVNTQVSVPNGINLQGRTLSGTGGIDNVRGTPNQILTFSRADQTLRVGFGPGPAAINNLRLGRSAAVLASDQAVTITSLNSDGSPSTLRRTVESANGIVVNTLFTTPPAIPRPDLRVRGPLTLNGGTSPRLLETDTVTFNGGRVADLVSHGAVTIAGNLSVDNRAVFQQGATVHQGATLTTRSVFGDLALAGTWTSSGAMDITGRLRGNGTVAGNLTVNGTGRYTNGNLDAPLDLVISNGGIAPGTATTPGTLGIGGTLVLRNATSLSFRVGGAGASDQLRFASAGATDLTGTALLLQPYGDANLSGSTLALLVNTGTGSFAGMTFSGLAEGADLRFGNWLASISYRGSFDAATGIARADGAGNDVVLFGIAPVPEPSPALLFAAGLVVAALASRRKSPGNGRCVLRL